MLTGLQHEQQKFHRLSSKFLVYQQPATENQRESLGCQNKPHRFGQFAACRAAFLVLN